jgi:hypothetical protein
MKMLKLIVQIVVKQYWKNLISINHNDFKLKLIRLEFEIDVFNII